MEKINMITKQDLNELKRMATNSYDNDKKFVNRIIEGIRKMDNEIQRLRAENVKLKEKS